jgi:hypothetical protein
MKNTVFRDVGCVGLLKTEVSEENVVSIFRVEEMC